MTWPASNLDSGSPNNMGPDPQWNDAADSLHVYA